jgi:serine/threonine protein kinase
MSFGSLLCIVGIAGERAGADSQIVHLYEAISVPEADALFLVLEYLPGGTLMTVHVGGDTSNAKPPFGREQAREYFRQLCLGLEYLHHNEVVHRDVRACVFPLDHYRIPCCFFFLDKETG